MFTSRCAYERSRGTIRGESGSSQSGSGSDLMQGQRDKQSGV